MWKNQCFSESRWHKLTLYWFLVNNNTFQCKRIVTNFSDSIQYNGRTPLIHFIWRMILNVAFDFKHHLQTVYFVILCYEWTVLQGFTDAVWLLCYRLVWLSDHVHITFLRPLNAAERQLHSGGQLRVEICWKTERCKRKFWLLTVKLCFHDSYNSIIISLLFHPHFAQLAWSSQHLRSIVTSLPKTSNHCCYQLQGFSFVAVSDLWPPWLSLPLTWSLKL